MKGVWGSTETIKAVTRMNAVNILIINARGECYFPLGFQMRLKKTVILTFGIVPVHAHTESDVVDQRQVDGCDASEMSHDVAIPNTKRNHYNSVMRMDQNDIYTVSQVLASVAYKRIQEQIDFVDTLKPDEI